MASINLYKPICFIFFSLYFHIIINLNLNELNIQLFL